MKNDTIILLKKIINHTSSKKKIELVALLLLMVVSSFSEILSIGAVLPFIQALTSPERLFELASLKNILMFLKINSYDQLPLIFIVTFCLTALLTGFIRLILIRLNTKISYEIGAELSRDIFKKTLYQPYQIQVRRNSSEIINTIMYKLNMTVFSITSALNLLTSTITLLTIITVLIYLSPIVAIGSVSGFTLIYLLITKFTKEKLRKNSADEASLSNKMIQILQEGIGGIRDIILSQSHKIFISSFHETTLRLKKIQGFSSFIGQFPRTIIESLGIILISIVAYLLTLKKGGLIDAIPVMGALALGTQKLLPMLQSIYQSWINIKSNHSNIEDTLELLDQTLPSEESLNCLVPIKFEQKIQLIDVSFRYQDDSNWVLKNINLTINKGEKIGIIGTTGSGKSTLIDILMGLLSPTSGKLIVDNHEVTPLNSGAWMINISHVPQSVHITDKTIAENIAFGGNEDNVNFNRIKKAAKDAQLIETIENLEKKYETKIGERGILLSGGQRQRIAIARALYKNLNLIILDEATSALDNETENAVINAIENYGSNTTIIMIAHRLSTLKNCTRIFELCDFGVREVNVNR